MKKDKNGYSGLNRIFKSGAFEILIGKKGDGTFRDFFSDWKWILGYTKKYIWVILLYTALGMLSSTMALGSAYLSKMLINVIVEKNLDNVVLYLIAMVFATVGSLLLSSALTRISAKISINITNEVQKNIFSGIMDADWLTLNRYPKGDLLSRFNRDVHTVSENAFEWIPSLIINLYTFVVTFIVLFRTDPNMAWIALGSAPILIAMSKYIMRKIRENRQRLLDLDSQMTTFEVETFYNYDTVKSFGIKGIYENHLKGWQKKYKDYGLEYNAFEIKANIMMSLTSSLVTLIAFGYCLYRLWTGQLLYGDMTFFLSQRSNVSNRFGALVKTFPEMISSAVCAHRIRELTAIPVEKHDEASVETISKEAKDGLTIRMDDVTYSYVEGEPVYEHGSLYACPGEIVAILGPSGEGKTTVLRLLLGLIRPAEGSVTLTTKSGEAVNMNADLRPFFSYVPQGNSLISGTIADNLRMVKENATDDELREVLTVACAWDFVSALPDGIYSAVGERGAGLSEGQAQRIAVARALLRDAPVLLLDEATSALDMDTEERLLKNIIKKRPDKTCIVSTHRKSVLKQCNRIYYIRHKQANEISQSESAQYEEV